MFRALPTTIYVVAHLDAAKAWYANVLGEPAYFDEPFYVGFHVGPFELGLVPQDDVHTPGAGGTLSYWLVDDVQEAFDALLRKGASEREAVQHVGGGIRVATVCDPWGNVLGLMENSGFTLRA